MLNLQIKLLYEQYGWTAEQIGSLLRISPSVVRLTIEQEQYTQNAVVKTQADTQADIDQLKSVEVTKQQQLTPVMAAIELSLYAKIMDIINDCDTPSDVAHVVKAYKTLVQDTVVNTIVRDEKSNSKAPTVAVQIINEVL